MNQQNGMEVLDQHGAVYQLSFPVSEFKQATGDYSDSSLLRYPGGKTRAVKIISRLIPADVESLCSPFFGGGSLEIFLAAKGLKVYGYDSFEPLVNFWNCVQENPGGLAERVEEYFPLPKAEFYSLQGAQHKPKDRFERAAIFYVLNRASFSGATLSGGMSPKHPRFTKSSIERLRKFHNPNFSLKTLDFKESIVKHPDMFMYLDPPYLIKNHLYGNNGSTHKNFDHQGLLTLLQQRGRWILSYNNCREICDMYADYQMLYPKWTYGMSNIKESKEVLILSHDMQEWLKI
ncbi:MAG: DNA adenine methylase [Verrucomicrobiota bacterium]